MNTATAARQRHTARKTPRLPREHQPKPSSPLDDYISRQNWSLASGRSIRSLKRDAILGHGPRPFVYGKQVFYSRKAIAAYLESLAAERNGGGA